MVTLKKKGRQIKNKVGHSEQKPGQIYPGQKGKRKMVSRTQIKKGRAF